MLEKILDILTSEKVENSKIYVILVLIGFIVVYFSEKIPLGVSERGILQISGFATLLIGLALLLISTIDRIFQVSTLGGLADGLVSGLLSSFTISALLFAPNAATSSDDFFLAKDLYRCHLRHALRQLHRNIFSFFYKKYRKHQEIFYDTFIYIHSIDMGN
ncbi:hypothetical protein [Rhizobium sp. NRK18]|uniref:hypothetical protein n=1 Tax=Rhizobium sp. NRK18 TaxID=2964667 RepID=UPI0021C486CE|nr:hypothetical protein [Rhizobium sp. NRK18]MCQ2004510.1 hypothetical protein [Rhizobium sp. NRK18]